MKTQGISLVTSNVSDKAAVRPNKTNDQAFDQFMTDRVSKAGPSQQKSQQKSSTEGPETQKDTEMAEHSLPLKKETSVTDKGPDTPDKIPQIQAEAMPEETEDPADMVQQMAVMFQEVFSISMEFLQDYMRQNHMTLRETLACVGSSSLPENLQQLVMNMHGITDKAAFLTNDTLVQELNVLNQRFTQIIAEMLQVSEEDLSGVDPMLLNSLAEKLENAWQMALESDTAEPGTEQMTEFRPEETGQGFEVIVEEPESGRSGAQTGDFMNRRDAEPVANNDGIMNANLFTERLAEAFETSAGEEAVSARETMTHIVDQVVNQVKIRVLPETTNMEIMLHPESLGRVNIQVSATAGIAKATLFVENLMAKEALESQLVTLKQTFEEQGLKVDAVEVTVSEFGLNQENRQAQQEQKNGTRGRKFRNDAELEDSIQEGAGSEDVKAARRNVNSVIDYTA